MNDGNGRAEAGGRPKFGPGVRREARRLILRASPRRVRPRPGIRVLTYHLLPPAPQFREHVEAIRSVADIIDEDEFFASLGDPAPLAGGRSRVLLTFDDGYRQHLTGDALEFVRSLGLRPTVFMIAAGVRPDLGTPHRLVRAQRGEDRPLVTGEELRRAVDAGWYVGSHTCTHWDCASGTPEELSLEISESKAILEACLETEVRTFAFPWGKAENIGRAALAEVRRAGYQAAFTTRRGRISEPPAAPFQLPRDVVEDWWGGREVRACVGGALDAFRAVS